MRFAYMAPLVLALGACATQEPVQVASAAPAASPNPQMECHKESDLGSNMIHTVCTPRMNDAERSHAQAELANAMHRMTTGSLPDPTHR